MMNSQGQGNRDMQLRKQDDGRYDIIPEGSETHVGWVKKDGPVWVWEHNEGGKGTSKTRTQAAIDVAAWVPGSDTELTPDELLTPPADPTKLRNPDIKPDITTMDELSGVYSVKLPKAKGAKVRRLREAIIKALRDIEPDVWIRCDVCHEVATEDVDRCPFCGDLGGSEEGQDAAPAPSPEPQEEPNVDVNGDFDLDADEPEITDGDDGIEPEIFDEPDATPTVEVITPVVTGELMTTEETAMLNARADLDKRVERITELKRNIAGGGWDLGREIFTIYKEELWKARGHQSFRAFIEADLSIAKSLAYSLMDSAQNFKRADFLAVGQSKIVLIAKLPLGKERDDALEGAKAGDFSYRDLAAKTRASGGKGKKDKKPKPPANEGSDNVPEDEGGFTMVSRVDDDPITIPWRSVETGRKVKAHNHIGRVEDYEESPDCYAELELAEANISIRFALDFDEDGYPTGVSVQFVEAG